MADSKDLSLGHYTSSAASVLFVSFMLFRVFLWCSRGETHISREDYLRLVRADNRRRREAGLPPAAGSWSWTGGPKNWWRWLVSGPGVGSGAHAHAPTGAQGDRMMRVPVSVPNSHVVVACSAVETCTSASEHASSLYMQQVRFKSWLLSHNL